MLSKNDPVSVCSLFSSKISSQQLNINENITMPKTWPEWISQSNNNFNKFMQTLSAELSLENVLFIIEVTQYKSNIIKKMIKLNDPDRKTPKIQTPISSLSSGFPNIGNNTSNTEQSIQTH
eukprot:708617_1